MPNVEEAKAVYVAQIRMLLSDHPSELLRFNALWDDGKLREAYVFARDILKQIGVSVSAEAAEADENFFWLYMH